VIREKKLRKSVIQAELNLGGTRKKKKTLSIFNEDRHRLLGGKKGEKKENKKTG